MGLSTGFEQSANNVPTKEGYSYFDIVWTSADNRDSSIACALSMHGLSTIALGRKSNPDAVRREASMSFRCFSRGSRTFDLKATRQAASFASRFVRSKGAIS